MASFRGYSEAAGSRSGGKIVRARRAGTRKTPYERPGLSNLGSGGNPSWISRFILSPTRTVASSAGKLLSSAFVSDSSSSSSDSDSGDDVEDDVRDENRAEAVKKNGTLAMDNLLRKDFPPEKKDSKHIIEQLLMQETFSRAERDKLFQIIESRVVECQTIKGEAAGRVTEISNRAVDSDDGRPAICSTAILEAKKWLNEKRLGLGSTSMLKLDHGPCTLNSTNLPVVNDEEMGSPVDVAKSYMRARPPWASPSTNNFDFKSPSPLGLQLFKEETSYLISGNPLSSSKVKRESPASGSWKIQEEIRRIRLKATEELLRTPSAKLDWSSFASDHKSNSSSARSDYLKIASGDQMQHAVRSIDKSTNRSPDNTVIHNLLESKTTRDVSENKTCLLGTTSIVLQQDKDLETDPPAERKASSSSLNERERFALHEVAGLPNGSPPVPSSLRELVVEQNDINNVVEENNSSGSDVVMKGSSVEIQCKLLSEVSMEVPDVNENDSDKALSGGSDVGEVVSEGNENCKISSSKEKNGAGNVNTVEKPTSQSSVAAGKTGGRTAHQRRGRRRN
ncbi:protein KAKU4-like [Cucurbita pepo subsp. pepo]|uniref:protein KAKU4-like n=1 Tax=Cucurbita pepo subsp. pepo TaxID=3664 RepID=UPI000C9D9E8E|nr:protein KAKU4-like [Cucurbita pepo subsp. pepo]